MLRRSSVHEDDKGKIPTILTRVSLLHGTVSCVSTTRFPDHGLRSSSEVSSTRMCDVLYVKLVCVRWRVITIGSKCDSFWSFYCYYCY